LGSPSAGGAAAGAAGGFFAFAALARVLARGSGLRSALREGGLALDVNATSLAGSIPYQL
jgi:hypothetical protein